MGADDPRRGFRARPAAPRGGEVTGGAVEPSGNPAAGLAAGARPGGTVLAGVVIVGAARAVDLVAIRPGRAAGAVLVLGEPGLVRGGAAGGPCAAAAGVLPDGLGERVMIGDTGAHALGTALGAVLGRFWGGRGRRAEGAACRRGRACGDGGVGAAR
ncbi:hypothetical protein ACIF8T_09980 [Streptomyces sp. NPDC085946]|uniref:hypothetical protein n=1 Tax=Streptomyces sp. NPDC085946 TaxID=3365744 RepID=UPI0037CCEA03